MKIAILGCGKQAHKHITALKKAGVDEIVVFDIVQQLALALAEKTNVFVASSIEEIMTDLKVQGAIIATPTPCHFEHIKQALLANKNVFCEKPLCDSLHQTIELQRISQETGRFVQVGYVYRYVEAFKYIYHLLNSIDNPLGSIHSAYLRLGGRGGHSEWKHDKTRGGGAKSEMLVHMVDLAQWILGPIANILHVEEHLLRPTRIINNKQCIVNAEDMVLLTAFTQNNAHIVLQSDLVTPSFRQFLEIQGENGSFIGSIDEHFSSQLFLINATENYAAGLHKLSFPTNNIFDVQMKDFINNLNSMEIGSAASILDSHQILNVMSLIQKNIHSEIPI